MNKNKIIFIIIGAIIALLIILLISNLDSGSDKTTSGRNSSRYDLWVIGDKPENFAEFFAEFKKTVPKYKTVQFKVESFSNFEEYYYSLSSAISLGKGPDMFVLNNNEISIFEQQIIGVNSSIITPNDFRKKYKSVFSNDLIVTQKSGKETVELIKGIPIGYETLAIFYNKKRNIKSSDLASLSALGNTISRLKERYPDEIPIGMGNGETVKYSSDIVSQFFLLEKNVSGVNTLTNKAIKSGLSSYMLYGDKASDNKYSGIDLNLRASGKNNLDLFSEGKTPMIVGYPRMINDIEKKGYGKNYLDATIFPHYSVGKGKALVNYNYFAVNKDSKNRTLGLDILKYMTLEDSVIKYSKLFPYYLPALASLEDKLLNNRISPKYNIILKNFYNEDFELSSFDKGVKNIYDREVIKILDTEKNYLNKYILLNNSLICKKDKFLNLKNLSKACE